MAVICFASLKGGVGKTTLSIGVGHALAQRGCETLLIDLDPTRHASRFLFQASGKEPLRQESPLARLFLNADIDSMVKESGSILEAAQGLGISVIHPVKAGVAMIPSGPELRNFLWGKGSSIFNTLFPKLLDELSSSYDYIIVDTPPDFNILTRRPIASSDMIVVPVDTSAMSINCLEELIANCSHIKNPCWAILRTMVNRSASTVQKLSAERLQENLTLCSSAEHLDDDEDSFEEVDMSNPEAFLSMIEEHERGGNGSRKDARSNNNAQANQSPIYLLNSYISRSEQQNKLTFLGKTVFDVKVTAPLAKQYSEVAREVEQILSYLTESEDLSLSDDVFMKSFCSMQTA